MRKYHAKTRVFSGKKYDLVYNTHSKREAEARAITLRKQGRLCRIVEWDTSNLPSQYLIYARFK